MEGSSMFVRSTRIYLHSDRHPKLAGSRADTKQGRRIGVESRVLSLINKARGLELPSFSLSPLETVSIVPSLSPRPRSSTFVHPFIFELLARMLPRTYRIL